MAVMSLIELNTPESNRVLTNLIADLSLNQYYIYVVMALTQRNWINPVPYIRRLFDDEAENCLTDNHLAGIVLLQDYPHHPDTMPLLTQALKRYHGQEIWQYCTIQSLARIGTDDAVYLVAQVMKQHDDVLVRADAAQELGTVANPLAGQVLLNYLEQAQYEGHGTVVVEALRALGKQIASPHTLDMARTLRVLESWLYQEGDENPMAMELLENLSIADAAPILERYKMWHLTTFGR
jgi:hypothetical protein